ncbi:MAG: sensor histidine kinase, partial [Dactylosporangium sp.]|nr:sensor histidine kinase [Dactylosporangium sp.]
APYRSELPPLWPVELGLTVASLAGAWVAGLLVRSRRTANARLATEIAHAAAVEERLRISRELHDIIGHSLSLIAVKATVANHVADVRPEEARAALTVIEHTSRTTLTEIRRVLGALRSDTNQPHVDMPRAGLDALAELADRVTSTGLAVDLDMRSEMDDGRPLPTAVGVSVYRIVQEALTNVVAHSAATRCRVVVHVGRREVTIEVTDPGPPRRTRPAAEGGYGLIGMRERALLYGGTFQAGPDRDGGFRVSARLPYESAGVPQ